MTYEIIKALHIISFISWMAGMLYLPRLFVYHTQVVKGSEASELFKVMEKKLLRYIMNPAMIASWIFGIWLLIITEYYKPAVGGWMHAKFLLVLLLSACHAKFSIERKKFAKDGANHSERYYKWLNEVPTVLMIGIVFLVVLKPF